MEKNKIEQKFDNAKKTLIYEKDAREDTSFIVLFHEIVTAYFRLKDMENE